MHWTKSDNKHKESGVETFSSYLVPIRLTSTYSAIDSFDSFNTVLTQATSCSAMDVLNPQFF